MLSPTKFWVYVTLPTHLNSYAKFSPEIFDQHLHLMKFAVGKKLIHIHHLSQIIFKILPISESGIAF